jgi:hypothetical protein
MYLRRIIRKIIVPDLRKNIWRARKQKDRKKRKKERQIEKGKKMKGTEPKRELKGEIDIGTSKQERKCSTRLELRLMESSTKELRAAVADFNALSIITLNVENRENHGICSRFHIQITFF